MKLLKNINLYSRLALATSVTLVVGYFVVYAAYQTFVSSEYQSGAALSSIFLGKIVSNLDEINGRVTTLEGSIAGASVWSKVGSDINYTAGKVGIGTVSPNKSVHIQTTTGTNAELDIQSGTKPLWGIYHDETTEELRFWNGANRVVIGSTGNMGIGTISPTSLLHLKAAANTSTILSLEVYGGAVDRLWKQFISPSDGKLYIQDSTASSNRLTIDISGNVGIGTTTPAQKLSVAGTVESTSGGFKFPDGTTQSTSASSSSVPIGAVMAFNLASCPTGWTALASAAGKTIVGLNAAETEFNTLLKTGGEKTHILTVAEMPSHSHVQTVRNTTAGSIMIPEYTLVTGNQSSSASTQTTGGGGAHNVLQPYLTLLYCQKN